MRSEHQNSAGITVMVVDDEPQVCQLLEKILREEGYQVLVAQSGRDALALATGARPQIFLFLLDIVMPDMDGMATLRELRRQGHQGEVVIITAQGTVQTARQAMLLGAFDYITKPFNLELLKSVVREALRDRLEEQRELECAP